MSARQAMSAQVVTSSADVSSFLVRPMEVNDLAEVMAIENEVYPYPWTYGNFLDSIYSGYEIWTVCDEKSKVAGYFLMMLAIDEAHLLNIAVRSNMQGQGVARFLLHHLMALASSKGMKSIFLEVRPSNLRALRVYERFGFTRIGLRKGYYPADDQKREDAIVMKLPV